MDIRIGSLVCHASSAFPVLKPPLSMIEGFSKSKAWSWDQVWFAILKPFVTVLTFLVLKTGRFSIVAPQTIGTRNFVHGVCLQILGRSRLQGRDLLPSRGDQCFAYKCNMMFFEDSCQRLGYTFDVRKRSRRLAWLGWFNHLGKTFQQLPLRMHLSRIGFC